MANVSLKGNPIHTSGELPKEGAHAPDFTLVDSELKDRHLREFQGKRVLLMTVPSLDTPICSLSLKKFNERIIEHPEIAALLISADLPFAQSRICDAEGVNNIISLSMMRSKDFAKDYGILILDGPLEGICARSVLILDETGKVIYKELVSEINHEPNYDRAVEVLLG
jgi:thiol peroxidase